MTLTTTVEGATSDSYASLAEYQAYGVLRGWTAGASDAADEINLLKAMDYLARVYAWAGIATTSTQALQWPRVTSIYLEGYIVASDAIPQRIKDAQCEMAYLIQLGATPFATVSGGAVVKKNVKAGPVSSTTEYAAPREIPRYVAVEGLIEPFTVGGPGQINLVRG